MLNVSFTSRIPITKVTEFVIPGKNKTKVLSRVVEVDNKLTEIEYKVFKKTKNKIKEEGKYTSKRGFSNLRLHIILEKMQGKLKEGHDFLMELAQAQINKG